MKYVYAQGPDEPRTDTYILDYPPDLTPVAIISRTNQNYKIYSPRETLLDVQTLQTPHYIPPLCLPVKPTKHRPITLEYTRDPDQSDDYLLIVLESLSHIQTLHPDKKLTQLGYTITRPYSIPPSVYPGATTIHKFDHPAILHGLIIFPYTHIPEVRLNTTTIIESNEYYTTTPFFLPLNTPVSKGDTISISKGPETSTLDISGDIHILINTPTLPLPHILTKHSQTTQTNIITLHPFHPPTTPSPISPPTPLPLPDTPPEPPFITPPQLPTYPNLDYPVQPGLQPYTPIPTLTSTSNPVYRTTATAKKTRAYLKKESPTIELLFSPLGPTRKIADPAGRQRTSTAALDWIITTFELPPTQTERIVENHIYSYLEIMSHNSYLDVTIHTLREALTGIPLNAATTITLRPNQKLTANIEFINLEITPHDTEYSDNALITMILEE